jgi:prepilin-type N-terminal cleavage/methylation domain-containing protein
MQRGHLQMLNKLKKREQGFTIIEVLIVLAIAGLILLIVFLAVPALQRNSRNTQRKADVSAAIGAVSDYANNHSGTLPSSQATLNTSLAEGKYGYFTGNPTGTYGTGSVTNPNNDTLVIAIGSKCTAANDATNTGASARSIVALYSVEGTTGLSKACQES